MTVKVYDFFAGCGGASCGFQAAGMEIAFALDQDADSKASFEANFPEAHFELADIRNTSIQTIRHKVEAGVLRQCSFADVHHVSPSQDRTRHGQSWN